MYMAKELACDKTNEQCRTHHEKMIIKFKDIAGIIAGVPTSEQEL